MVKLTETEPYSGLNSTKNMPCSICGSDTDHRFKQGFVCEDCLKYVTCKIKLNMKASKPAAYPEKS